MGQVNELGWREFDVEQNLVDLRAAPMKATSLNEVYVLPKGPRNQSLSCDICLRCSSCLAVSIVYHSVPNGATS